MQPVFTQAGERWTRLARADDDGVELGHTSTIPFIAGSVKRGKIADPSARLGRKR
jgi:hypothetical protein